MFPKKCKAILKMMDDSILEYGQAEYSAQDEHVDFTAQFVPILQIKTQVKILCSESGITTHIFSGEVYLSSPKLLRIVSLSCIYISGAEKVLAAHSPFPAQILVPTFQHKLIFNKTAFKWMPCTVNAISLSGVAVECPQLEDEYIEKVTVRIAEPIFSKPTDLHLHTGQKGLMFGNHTKYKYKTGKLSKRTEAELCTYIRLENKKMLGNIRIIDESSLY